MSDFMRIFGAGGRPASSPNEVLSRAQNMAAQQQAYFTLHTQQQRLNMSHTLNKRLGPLSRGTVGVAISAEEARLLINLLDMT